MIEKNILFWIKLIICFKIWKWNGEYFLVVFKVFIIDSWL